ncbi:MAG: hypothetical protein FJ241_10500 [Nitrospira sp.]|nr:hypothetical protein [Nitrospira sp.]
MCIEDRGIDRQEIVRPSVGETTKNILNRRCPYFLLFKQVTERDKDAG